MIYVKFGLDNKATEMTNVQPEDGEYFELADDFMGKRLMLAKGKVREFTEKELQAEYEEVAKKATEIEVRHKRDTLLVAADVLSQLDRWDAYSQGQKDSISAYKQALRDIPQQVGFPNEIVWPQEVTL